MIATPRSTRTTVLALTGPLLAASIAAVLTAAPAVAGGGDDVRTHGACSGSTDWKMKAKADDARVEVEAEIDSNKVGQAWTWKLKRDGVVLSAGQSTTHGPSGSFSVTRRPVDRSGPDSFVFRAVNPASGEVCRATVTW